MPKLQFWQPLVLVFVCYFACYHFHETQRRPDFVVPAFVSTFALLIPAVTSSTNTTAVTPLSLSGISSLVQTPILHQPFVVSPGFSPVPVKLVSQVTAGKFVQLNKLLSANLVLNELRASILLFWC